MNTSEKLLNLIIVFMIACILILFHTINVEKENASFIEFSGGSHKEKLKVNCDVENVYSMDDYTCSLKCKQPGVYVSKNGVCINSLALSHETIQNDCNPKKGVLAYLLGDPQFGTTKLICLSIDQGIQPDDVNKENRICGGNGQIDINYVESFPQINACKCPNDKILAIIPSTSAIRSRSVCVNKNLSKIYKLSNTLFNNQYV